MSTLATDIRYAFRQLIGRPGFSVVAILTVAIGIGATTSIFSVVYAVLLRPLPFGEADRLAAVRIESQAGDVLPDADFVAWRAQNRTADAVAVYSERSTTLTGDGAPERVFSAEVSDRFFDVLGARPMFGRVFQDGDDRPGAAKTAIISHALWMRRYNGDRSIVGRSILLSGIPFVVVGVMPPDFSFPADDTQLWRILTIAEPTRRGPFYSHAIARLKPGVTFGELRGNLASVEASLKQRYPGPGDWKLDAIPLQDAIVGNVRIVLYVLFGAVGVLLLIAIVNVANLLLARTTTREREIAVRGALGAARGRIVRQLITESLVLSVVSGAAGFAIAVIGTRALIALAPGGIPRLGEVRMSTTVFGFSFAAATLCGLLFGIVPALRASRTPLVETLKDGGRGATAGRHRRAQRALVVAEIALALTLSVGAGLMLRSFLVLQRVNPGFDASHLLTFRLSLPDAQYPDQARQRTFFIELLGKLDMLPGVQASALTISLPPHLLLMTDNFMVEGQQLPANQSAPLGPLLFVSENYFATLGARLLAGRFFSAEDDDKAPTAIIINETLARRYFAGVDPVGKRLKTGGPERPIGPRNPWKTIVGVVSDINYSGLDAPSEPAVYYPFRQATIGTQYVVVRTAGNPGSVANEVRDVVAAMNRDLPMVNLKTMDQLLRDAVAPPRFRTILVSMFAAVGLLLAAIGTYGVIAYAVTARTHELGVRMALGAERREVLRMILGDAMKLVGAGTAIGLVGAFAAARLISSLLFGIAPTDALTFAAIVTLLVATALVASFIPARRATRVDPLVALRYE